MQSGFVLLSDGGDVLLSRVRVIIYTTHHQRCVQLNDLPCYRLHMLSRMTLYYCQGANTAYLGENTISSHFSFPQLHSNMDKGDGSVRYVLTGDGAGTLFLIDEKSGDIHATKRLDREEKAMYTLNAKVLDRNTNAELEPDTEFNIKIHDINDNAPKFVKEIYFASVPEMSDVGELQLNPTDGCLFEMNRAVALPCCTLMIRRCSLGIQHKGNYLAFKEERLKVEIVTGQLRIRFIELNFIPLKFYKQTT